MFRSVLKSLKTGVRNFSCCAPKKTAVVALGGNALVQQGENGEWKVVEERVRKTCEIIANFYEQGYNVALSHGNGPQVGSLMLQNDAGLEKYDIPEMPLHVCVAQTQGSIGYILEKSLREYFNEKGEEQTIISLLTQVEVDPSDEAFLNPSKPVGAFYTEEQYKTLSKENPEWNFKEIPNAGFRRVVPSPQPQKIVNSDIIKEQVEQGRIVIACGGGGIPVEAGNDHLIHGIDAVIDKDLCSAVLAKDIEADKLCIFTDVEAVYLNFGEENEEKIGEITISEMQKHIDNNEFTAGSMLPKVQACMKFVENSTKSGSVATIAKLDVEMPTGTTIIH